MCQKNGSIASFYSAASKSIAFQAGLRPPQQLKLPATRFISNAGWVMSVMMLCWNYLSHDPCATLFWPCLAGAWMNLLIQLNFVPESRVCKSLQKSWNWLTCSWQLHVVIGPFLTAGYLSELSTMTRASLAHFLQACMNFSWTWSILDDALFKII